LFTYELKDTIIKPSWTWSDIMKDSVQEKFDVYGYIDYYFNHTYNVVLA
jgi:hypothetical protein